MLAHLTELPEKVEQTAKAFAPDVVRIRYRVGEDWTGDPSVHLLDRFQFLFPRM